MKERLRASDYRFILICAVLLAATTAFSVRNFYRAFPEASIDFKVSRGDARNIAAKFLSDQGYRVEGYRHAAQFTYDEEAKTFLERQVGLERANRIMGSRVRLWRWAYRWFRPLEKEEYNVEITPLGQLAGFEHELPEDAARPAATTAQARALAEDFLRTRLGRDPASLDFVESTDVARPHRVDRTFTWKERDFQLGDATNRLEVTVLGNEVGGYREYLKVPEQWKRDYQLLRSKNEIAATIDTAVTLVLVAGMVIMIVLRVRSHDVRWRRAAMVGLMAIVLGFLAQLNEFPLHEFGYPTTDSYGSFLSREFLNALLAALGAGGLLFVLTAGAEPLYREMLRRQDLAGQPFHAARAAHEKLPAGLYPGPHVDRHLHRVPDRVLHRGVQVRRLVAGRRAVHDLLNTRFPWAFVLFGGFLPAVSEEFLFRMFAIPFLRKMTRSLAVAVVLAGFIWGFGHAGYPQQPFYIRGVEVGLGGVALGIIMLRFGILPTLVWHYSVDAMYSAMLLVRSESLYFKLSGIGAAGIMVLPVLIAVAAYWRYGGFEPETGLLNRDDAGEPGVQEAAVADAEADATATAAAPPDSLPYLPMGVRLRWVCAGVLVLGIASLAIPVAHFGESPNYQLSRDRARAAADTFVKSLGLDPAAFQHVTYPAAHWEGPDALAGKYFLERLPVAAASALFERNRPIQVWITRYFKSLDQEEITVSVHPETGKVTGFTHTIPETQPGADLDLERARQIAAQFAKSLGWDTATMDLKESSTEQKKARRDYSMEWEARARRPAQRGGDTLARGGECGRRPRGFGARFLETAGGLAAQPRAAERTGDRHRGAQDRHARRSHRVWFVAAAAGHPPRHRALARRPARGAARDAAVPARAAALHRADAQELSHRYSAGDFSGDELRDCRDGFRLRLSVDGGGGRAHRHFLSRCRGGAATDESRRYGGGCGDRAAGRHRPRPRAASIPGRPADRFHAQAVLSIGSPDIIVSAAPAIAAVASAVRTLLTDGALIGLIVLLAGQITKRWMRYTAALLALVRYAAERSAHTRRIPGAVHDFAGHGGRRYRFLPFFGRRNYLAYICCSG